MGSINPAEIKSPPEKLQPEHDVSKFDCAEPVLNDWLRRRALQNQQSGASSSYVVLDKMRVAGYYSLAAGSVARETAPGRVRRNVPDPVPMVVLGRLAIDQDYQGQGLGRALLRDAILRILQAADIIGVRAILVHALSEEAKRFYEECGFAASPIDPLTLMITLQEAIGALPKK
ncbi:MAG: GNAT family N-acetyltransferase [Candidatus Binatia bacterium]